MSDQGEVPDGRGFGLIETLLWTRAQGFALLDEHLSRLRASSGALGFPYEEPKVRAALEEAVRNAPAERLRVRLVAHRDGALEAGATPIEPVPPGAVWRVAIAARRFNSADPLLRHKTTRRDLYEDALAEAAASRGVDEVIFLNERDEVCEAARANVFLAQGGALLTPPLACGLLPGTLRAKLLAEGGAREEILRPGNLAAAAELYLGNSVRGLVRAKLVAA